MEADRYLLDINLEDIETTSRERQEYWLLDIQAAQKLRILRDSERNVPANGKTA